MLLFSTKTHQTLHRGRQLLGMGLLLWVVQYGIFAQKPAARISSEYDYFEQAYAMLLGKEYAKAHSLFDICCTKKHALGWQLSAAFYQGVARYHQKRYPEAMQLFVEVEQQAADTLLVFAKYMRAHTQMAQGDSLRAYRLFSALRPSALHKLAIQTCVDVSKRWSQQHIPQLLSMYVALPQDSVLEASLTRLLAQMTPLGHTHLRDTLDTEKQKVLDGILRKKSPQGTIYQVAVLMPFAQARGSGFILQLYQGMLLAIEQSIGAYVRVRVYDTSRSRLKTQRIVRQMEQNKPDMVIGPLHQQPIEVVQDFCKRYQIPMLNPLSTNPDILSHPWARLLHASDRTRIQSLVQHTSTRFADLKTVAVFCEQDARVRTMCKQYVALMRENGYEIVMEEYAIGSSTTQQATIQEMLTEVVTESVELEIDPEDAEGLEQLQAEYAALGYLLKPGGGKYGESKNTWQIERWKVGIDSIGHIFLGAKGLLLPAYVVGAIEARPDNIPIFMPKDVLTHGGSVNASLDYYQLERLGVFLYANNHMDSHTEAYQQFRNAFIARWGSLPSHVAALGYELMHYVVWAAELERASVYSGPLGLRLQMGGDNQLTQLLQFEQGRLKQVYELKR